LAGVGALQNSLYNTSESCLKNVITPLAEKLGFDVVSFYNFLGKGADFYDGTKSTVSVAGNVTSPAAANAAFGPNATVNSVFARTRTDPTTGATLRIDALTSITTSNFTSYFRPDAIDSSKTAVETANNAGLLFHEALHGFGGTLGGTSYFDDDIKDAFGITGASSHGITEHIAKNCFQ